MRAEGVAVEAFLCAEPDGKKGLVWSAARIIIALAGTLGTVFSFLTCIDTGVSGGIAAAAVIMSVILYGAVFSLKGKKLLLSFGAVFGAYAAALFYVRERFCNGLASVMNIYLARVRHIYAEKNFIDLLYPESAAADTRIFIIYVSLLIALLYTYGIVYRSSLPAVLAASVPPVELCLYFGLAPSYAAFFAVLASWVAVFALDLSSPEKSGAYRSASSQCGFAAAAAALICAVTAFMIMQLSGYSRPLVLDEIHSGVKEYINGDTFKNAVQEIKLTEIVKRDGTVDHGKLGENGNITFDNKPVLSVTMPKTANTVYLRGFVGSVYTGKSWEDLPQSSLDELAELNGSFSTEGMNTLLLSSYNLKTAGVKLPEYSFYVKNISAEDEYLYMPYNLVPESVLRYNIEDDIFSANGEKDWFGRIYDPSQLYGYSRLMNTAWNLHSASLAADQSRYRNFVYANYLDIPDNFTAADEVFDRDYYEFITAESEAEGKSTLTDAVVFGRKLYYIRSWLRDNCSYSLKAGKLPFGKDFADYFVTETKEGSCSHFATAAVLLCRYAGIPARYIEGYVIKPGDFDEGASFGSISTVEVTDARAHAWAEVYIDGYGWYPMEFTSGYGNVITAVTTVKQEEETEETTAASTVPEEEPSVVTSAHLVDNGNAPEQVSEASDSAQTVVSEVPVPASEEPSVSESSVREQGAPKVGFTVFGRKGGEKVDVVYDLTWLLAVALVLLLTAAVIVTRRIVMVKSSRKAPEAEPRAAAKQIYRRFRRLVKAMGLPVEADGSYAEYISTVEEGSPYLTDGAAETVIKTALKAEFGGGSVTREEIREMYSAVGSASKRYLNSLSAPKRFFARFITGIIG